MRSRRPKATSASPPSPELIWRRLEAIAERAPKRIQRRRMLGRRLRPAGVLVPLYRTSDGRPHLLFTKRTDHLPTHKGEISFPGGGRRDQDADLGATALRETWEELGIDIEAVRIIGPFDDVWSLHGYKVTPFVAEIPPPPVPRVNRGEVAEVIEVDVMALMDEKIHRQTRIRWIGRLLDLHYYDYGRHTIWGMTGIIVHRLLAWIRRGDPVGRPKRGS